MKSKNLKAHATAAVYQIQVQGSVDPRWSDCFTGLTLTAELDAEQMPLTTLTGRVPDQAALRGILNKLWDLNVTLTSVKQIAPTPETEVHHDD